MPLVKSGGLGDVAGALPLALHRLGVDIRILMPAYRGVTAQVADLVTVHTFPPQASLPEAALRAGRLPNGVPLLLVDCPLLFDRDGGPYLDPAGKDWSDNAARFGMLSRVAASIAQGAWGEWRPDVLHANDWQAALAPAWLHLDGGRHVPSVVTVHNLAFQGVFAPQWLPMLGLPPESWSMHGVEYYGYLSFLKAGLYYADAITTVSPTYAREIQTAPLGMGLEGLLASRSGELHGILNGIDTDAWNPAADTLITARYDDRTVEGKLPNKRLLQQRMNLDADDIAPLFGMVSRLTHQKGIDLVLALADEIVKAPAQLVMVGTGDAASEAAMRAVAMRYPGRVGVFIGYDEALAHQLEAGADVFLMPSRFEPCGMNQMYSQRYGTPPVACRTGGLADSVIDWNGSTASAGEATGFLFDDASVAGLRGAIRRVFTAWRHPDVWRQLQLNGMRRDFTWDASAATYLGLYRELLAAA